MPLVAAFHICDGHALMTRIGLWHNKRVPNVMKAVIAIVMTPRRATRVINDCGDCVKMLQ